MVKLKVLPSVIMGKEWSVLDVEKLKQITELLIEKDSSLDNTFQLSEYRLRSSDYGCHSNTYADDIDLKRLSVCTSTCNKLRFLQSSTISFALPQKPKKVEYTVAINGLEEKH